MKNEEKQAQFSRFFRRLTIESVLNAFVLAVTVGFGVVFVLSTVTWFTETNSLWLCVALLAGVAMVGLPIFYFTVFRPTLKANAKRIDRLGLEERTITMVELENEDSILAKLQREDAQTHLAQADEKQIKIRVPKKLIVSVSVAAVLGITMATLSTLAALGYIMSGAELLEPIIPEPPVQYVYVEYLVDEGGYIEGEEYQEIVLGQSGTEVMAVAEDGWIFVGWEDGSKNPDRYEINVTSDKLLVAIFAPAEGDGNPMMEGPDGEPMDIPSEDADGEDGNNPDGNSSAGGKYLKANQCLDGQTYYRDVYQQYADQTAEELTSGEEVPEDIQKVIESYYDIIE